MDEFPFSGKKGKNKIQFLQLFYFGGSASTRDDQYNIQFATF
jgi:hypothetical protein